MDKASEVSKGKLSRRDFLKIAGVTAGALAARPLVSELANNLEDNIEKETVLIGARQFLIKNEDVPPGIESVPSANEHFMFADQILEKSLAIYKDWALKENLPQPFFRKSKSYFDYSDAKSLGDIGQFGLAEYSSFLNDLFSKDYQANGTDDFLVKFKERSEATLAYAGAFLTDYAEKKQSLGSKPITFSNEVQHGAKGLLSENPGSAILNRVCSTLGTGNYEDLEGRENEIGDVLHKEIDPIWDWVRNHVAKSGKPMTSDIFLAKLLYENRGNITESLWDKVVLEKLISRSNPTTFEFNMDFGGQSYMPNYQQYIDSIKNNQDMFLGLIQDNFAPRLSANYINKNVRQDELFAYNQFEDVYKDGRNYKPFDSYCAAGNIYHGSNLMALATSTSPEILQLMLLYKDFYSETGTVKPHPNYGLEKITADLLVGYRAKEVRKILDSYSV